MGDFMRKALFPLLASLLICGTATAALIATNAHADQTGRKPVMMLAQNQPGRNADREAGPPPPPDMEDGMMGRPHRGQFCQDIYAREAGEMAFLEAKLQLTPSQQPLFMLWKDISMDIAKRHEGDCGSRVTRLRADGERPDLMARLNLEEEMLKTRLADLDAKRPALTALYEALTPTQREELSRAARNHGAHRMRMMGMMRHAPEMGRRLGRGPAGEPSLTPQPPQ
jgi:hypothetical protein